MVSAMAPVAGVGLGYDNLRPVAACLKTVRILKVIQNRATVARLVAHDFGSTCSNAQVGVCRNAGAKTLFEDLTRRLSIGQSRQDGEFRFGWLRPKFQAQLGQVAAPLLIPECRPGFDAVRRGETGWDHGARDAHDLRPPRKRPFDAERICPRP